jgi:hypothetical protein
MDEKYINDIFTQLGGESKFGSFSDFKDLMQNDAQYRKDFHASIGEDTLGKFGDFDNLVKKKGGQASETGGQAGTSPAQSPSQSPSTSEEPKQPENPPGTIWLRDNLYIDRTAIANVHYREYEYYNRKFSKYNFSQNDSIVNSLPYFGYEGISFIKNFVFTPNPDSARYKIDLNRYNF